MKKINFKQMLSEIGICGSSSVRRYYNNAILVTLEQSYTSRMLENEAVKAFLHHLPDTDCGVPELDTVRENIENDEAVDPEALKVVTAAYGDWDKFVDQPEEDFYSE